MNALGLHFISFYSDSVSEKQWKAVVKYRQRFKNELVNPKEVITLSWDEGSVEELHKFEGYECTTYKKLLGADSTMI